MPNTLQIRDVLPLRYNWLYYRLQQKLLRPMSISMLREVLAQESAHQKRHISAGDHMSHYKAFDHQHLGEINQSVNQLQADYTNELIFVPNRGMILQEEFSQLYIRQSRKA
jgi:hypothetical protein